MNDFVADAIYIDAPPERVYRALLDPREVLKWMDAEEAVVGAHEGGEFLVRWVDGTVLSGVVAELREHQEISVDPVMCERDGDTWTNMRIFFYLEPKGAGVWFMVRQERLASRRNWQAFANRLRDEWVETSVRLKRHIEGI